MLEQLRSALCGTGHVALRQVEIEVYNDVIALWGHVPTYYQKQLAQAVAQRVSGVRGVTNDLEVICRRPNGHAERP